MGPITPGAQPAINLSTDDGGSPRARRPNDNTLGLSHQERKELRKLSKVCARPTEDGKTKQQ